MSIPAEASHVDVNRDGSHRHLPRSFWGVSATIALVVLALGIVLFAIRNLGNRYFWADESSTFLNALGLPEPGQSLGSWDAMWFGTTHAFLDPGLFHVLLRWWILGFGPEMEILRAFPLLLFLAYVAAVILLSRRMSLPWVVSIAVGALMMIENITPYYAVEVRPYSGGQAASVVIPLLALALIRRNSWTLVVIYMIGFLFFSSMQFNSAPITAGVAALLLAVIWVNHRRGGALASASNVRLITATVITLAWLPLVYVVTRGSPFKDPQADVIYMDTTIMRYMPLDEAMRDLATNLFSWTALPRTVFIIVVPIAILILRSRRTPIATNPRRWAILLLWIYVLVSTVASAGAALLGFLPWVVGTRWSITEIGLVACSIIGLLALGHEAVPRISRAGSLAVILVSLMVTLAGSFRIATYERMGDVDYLSTFAPVMLEGKRGGTMIDYWLSTDVRYWMEFSPEFEGLRVSWLAHDPRYPTDFDPADASDLREFLASPADRFLLRSERALTDIGVPIPVNVAILRLPPEDLGNVPALDAPVLLVKSGV